MLSIILQFDLHEPPSFIIAPMPLKRGQCSLWPNILNTHISAVNIMDGKLYRGFCNIHNLKSDTMNVEKVNTPSPVSYHTHIQLGPDCPACRTTLVATRFRVAVICPIIQVPHCIRVFFHFVWFVFINHIFQFYYELCTYCDILDIYLS